MGGGVVIAHTRHIKMLFLTFIVIPSVEFTFQGTCKWVSGDCDIGNLYIRNFNTVVLQWLEHLWDHENMFETG